MKTKLILILILFSVSSTLFGQVTFTHTNIPNAKSQAASSNLPYFVYIYGDWCLPCQIMEETTFKSLDLQNAIDQKYTAYKVDFHSEAGAEWVAAHDICCLPTFLFFDEHGNKTQQIQSPLTANGFIQVLDSPQSYTKQDKKFASANSAERLKSQVSTPTEMLADKENLVGITNSSEAYLIQSSTNATRVTGEYSKYNDTQTSNDINISANESSSYSNTIETAGVEDKSVFLNDLRKHITSLETVYAKYEIEEGNNKLQSNLSSLAQMEGFSNSTDSKSDCKCENAAKNAKELAETIKELKTWEAQLGALSDLPNPVQTKINVNPNPDELISAPSFISNTSEEPIYYSVQMGMFKTESYARRMVDDLAKSYTYSVEMKLVDKADDTLYRVLLGPFINESEAKEVYSTMKKDGRKAVVGVF